MKTFSPEFEARPTVELLTSGFAGEVATNCHAIRIINTSQTAPLMLDVSGNPFPIAPGAGWGLDTGDVRVILRQPLRLTTGTATAQVERIFLTLSE